MKEVVYQIIFKIEKILYPPISLYLADVLLPPSSDGTLDGVRPSFGQMIVVSRAMDIERREGGGIIFGFFGTVKYLKRNLIQYWKKMLLHTVLTD